MKRRNRLQLASKLRDFSTALGGFRDRLAYDALELRIRTILPEQYQDRYEDVQPVSMGSASLKFDDQGNVAWDDIWGGFCDLAMAGGPPHKGHLLEPASQAEIDAQLDRYQAVVDELCRGVKLVTGLPVERSPNAGWIRVYCPSSGMAAWLLRAIVMENVSVRCDANVLDLPAGPDFRIAKEIKNVITVMAKTSHYWQNHMSLSHTKIVSDMLQSSEREMPLIEPSFVAGTAESALRQLLAFEIEKSTGLKSVPARNIGWLGIACPDVKAAIWTMRALVAGNVLSRREETVLFVPVNPVADPHGKQLLKVFTRTHGFAKTRGLF